MNMEQEMEMTRDELNKMTKRDLIEHIAKHGKKPQRKSILKNNLIRLEGSYSETLDLSAFKGGMYFIKISSSNKEQIKPITATISTTEIISNNWISIG